jgi:hypothetical protein
MDVAVARDRAITLGDGFCRQWFADISKARAIVPRDLTKSQLHWGFAIAQRASEDEFDFNITRPISQFGAKWLRLLMRLKASPCDTTYIGPTGSGYFHGIRIWATIFPLIIFDSCRVNKKPLPVDLEGCFRECPFDDFFYKTWFHFFVPLARKCAWGETKIQFDEINDLYQRAANPDLKLVE